MKQTMVVIATLLTLVVSSALAGGKIYRAIKPYWWTTPAMMCHPPNDEGVYWCRAGAWSIRGLSPGGYEDSISATGAAGYNSQSKGVGLSISTVFGDHDITFTCAGQTEPLPVRRVRQRAQAGTPVFEYWVWSSRAEGEQCLLKPIAMTVDGKVYRLDTKLLRQAVENAIDRATDE